ncbi:MAG: DUF2062 domain-containing protein [Phycisphaerae bacterium]|nr:DUF2062 domain-containing protein [Phycisphaerae bacterium]
MAKKRKHPILRYIEYKIIHIEDSPVKIALGLAIGLFVAWTPLLGLHILIVLALAVLFRANKFIALTSVWVANVFTFAIIYYPSYLLGRYILNIFIPEKIMSSEQITEAFNTLFSPSNILTGFFTKDYWRQFWMLSKTIGPELWLGGFIIGGLVALIASLICYKIVKNHRVNSPHRRYRHYE